MAESVAFDILAHDYASRAFRDVGNEALKASGKVDAAAASMAVFDEATRRVQKSQATVASTFATHTRALKLLEDAQRVENGEATRFTKLMADQGRQLEKASGSTGGLAARFSALAGTGGIPGGGMGAAIAAGVILSPIIATVGTGLAGLGLAAYGVIKPIAAAAQKAGGLKANLAGLDPEQRAAARSLLTLQASYDQFQKALKPVLLQDFNAAIAAARPLLRGIEPVAASTGKALGQVLAQVGAEFRSGEWQQFFGFMARTAGPDVRLLGDTFVNLTKTLPPLLQDLQPLGRGLLVVADDAAKAAHGLAGLWGAGQRNFPLSTQHTFNAIRDLDRWTVELTNHIPGAKKVNDWLTGVQHGLSGTSAASGPAARGIHQVSSGAQAAASHVQAMATAVTALNTAENKSLTTQLGYSNALITSANDAATLKTALKASSDHVGLYTQKQRDSFSAANTFITDLANTATTAYSSGHGVDAAIRAIRNGLPILDSAKTKNKLYWQEVATLKGWLDKLRLEKAIHENIAIGGSGAWRIITSSGQVRALGGHTGAAAGMLVTGGTPGRDSVLVNTMPGELIVPTPMVNAGAVDHLRGRIPGFAAGGVVPGYSGSVAGLAPWAARNIDATGLVLAGQMAAAVTAAALAAVRAAQAAAQSTGSAGPGGGAPAANAALARRMMPAWGSGYEWAAWNYVAMRESGWNQYARNPSSGAYGIPQALPPSKMGPAANPPQSNPRAQIAWMIGYIRSRYGDPAGAASHERAFNWYDQGGFLPTGLSLALNTTGRPEPVGLAAGARGGGNVTVNVNVAPSVAAANPALGRDIAQHLTAFLRHGGQLYPHGMTPR